jgi:hypothetical protein
MKLPRLVMFPYFKICISFVASVLIVIHIIRPTWKVDSIVLGLLAFAILPWIQKFIESAKLPGGYEIKFRDLNEAGKQIAAGQDAIESENVSKQLDESTSPKIPIDTSMALIQSDELDPNIALIQLRLEIEKRLRNLAHLKGLPDTASIHLLVRALVNKGLLAGETAAGLMEIIHYGNKAAHGAKVEIEAATWARAWGPKIIASLAAIR